MSESSASHDEHAHIKPGAGGDDYEEDLTGSTPGVIAAYVAFLALVFFVTVGGLYMYFRWETERELERKIYSVEPSELNELREQEEQVLTRPKDGMAIDQAIKALVKEVKAR